MLSMTMDNFKIMTKRLSYKLQFLIKNIWALNRTEVIWKGIRRYMIDCINFLYIQQFSSECLEQRGKNLSLATSSLHSFFFVSHIQICVGGRVWKLFFFLNFRFWNYFALSFTMVSKSMYFIVFWNLLH